MAITAQQLLTKLGNRAWSGFNKDDMIWGGDDAQTAQEELNVAVRYLINLEDFPFKKTTKKLVSKANQINYSMPNGQIECIVRDDNQEKLIFLGDGALLDKNQTGEPTGFYVDYNTPDKKLKLFPRPIEPREYTVTYSTFYPVADKDFTEQKMEFTQADDVINVQEDLEHLFADCLVLRTMVTNNKDQQDENYVPTINEFNEHWRVFKAKATPVRKDTIILGL